MMHFPLPDLAEFPDYLDEHKGEEIDSEIYDTLETYLKEWAADEFFAAFMGFYRPRLETLTQEEQQLASGWIERLLGFLKFYRDFKRPDFGVQNLQAGVYSTNVDTDALLRMVEGDLARLRRIEDWNPPPGTFDRGCNVEYINDTLNKMLRTNDVLETASAYLRHPVMVNHSFLHLASPTDQAYKQFFYDARTTPKWTHTHIDPKEDTVKAIIYLNDVNSENGAFGYVPGSNQFVLDPLQSIFGRAISTGSYCYNKTSRASVWQLPGRLRTSVNFGRMAFPGTWHDRFLTEEFRHYESSQGNMVVFDPGGGIHQGGLCKSGERIALQILMRDEPGRRRRRFHFLRDWSYKRVKKLFN